MKGQNHAMHTERRLVSGFTNGESTPHPVILVVRSMTMAKNRDLHCSGLRRRPLAILILGAVLLFLVAVGLVNFTISFAGNWDLFVRSPNFGALFPIGRIAIVGVTAVGLFRRWRWSRWAACALILIVAASPFKHIIQGTGSMVEADLLAGRNPEDTAPLRLITSLLWASTWMTVALILAIDAGITEYFRGHPGGNGASSEENSARSRDSTD
jgi:hypothetical protein